MVAKRYGFVPKNKKVFKWNLSMLCDMITRILTNKYDVLICLDGRRGTGKCLKKGSKVLMSNGEWKSIESLHIDDEILSPQQDGSVTFEKVKEMSNFYSNKSYEIREAHRRKTLLYTCSENHQIPIAKNRKIKSDSLTAMQIAQLSNATIKNSQCASFTTPKFTIRNPTSPKINPYILGVYLGDGSFSSLRKKSWRYTGNYKGTKHDIHNGNWLHRQLNISNSKPEIIEYVSSIYPVSHIYLKSPDYKNKMMRFSLNGEFAQELTHLGLEGINGEDKFIPKECLNSSIEYRRELLAGLLDTDGYIRIDGTIDYDSKSLQLVKDVQYLVFSLGGYSQIKKIRKGIKRINFMGTYYRASVWFKNPLEIPLKTFKGLRLKEAIQNRIKKQVYHRNHIGIEAKLVKQRTRFYGITISGKSKYFITDNFMVTHNSTLAWHIAMRVGNRITPYGWTGFNPHRDILFSQDEVLKAVIYRWKGIIFADEAIQIGFLRDFYNEKQKKLIRDLTLNRDHNNLIIMRIPSFSSLDKQIRNMTKIRISVHKRGFAVIQTPNKTMYSPDIWDTDVNAKIEREWIMRNPAKPKFSKLTTFRGVMTFPDLLPKSREIYEAIKVDRRNKISTEEEGKEDKKDVYSNIIEMLKDDKLQHKKDFDNLCFALNLKPVTAQRVVRERLRNEGSEKGFQHFFRRDKAGFIGDVEDDERSVPEQIVRKQREDLQIPSVLR